MAPRVYQHLIGHSKLMRTDGKTVPMKHSTGEIDAQTPRPRVAVFQPTRAPGRASSALHPPRDSICFDRAQRPEMRGCGASARPPGFRGGEGKRKGQQGRVAAQEAGLSRRR